MIRALVNPLPMAITAPANIVGAARLATPEPKEVAVAGDLPGNWSIVVDLGSAQLIDTVAVLFLRGDDPSVVCYYGLDNVWQQQFAPNAAALPTLASDQRRDRVMTVPAPVRARYVGIGRERASASRVELGVIVIGRAFRPQWGGEWGGGVGLADTGQVTRRRDGGFAIDSGTAAPTLQWIFGDLSDDERRQLFAIVQDRGETKPLLAIEGGDGGPTTSEEVHWGLLTRIEAYERQAPGMTRWSMRFQDWI